ncbi:MAG: FlgD immunoglobulin-like domain containing protein [Candidatus Omnitrophica bacterium]|nr:FlgD immunoglobulin-like domain containing protein [Candidatus Omnitrophota bacterium]
MPEETDVGTHPITFRVTDGVETDQKTVTYTILHNSTPYTGSVSPDDEIVRSNEQLEFIATYFDNAGWQDIQDVYMSIGGAYFRYNLPENKLYASSNFSQWNGGYTPGTAQIIQVDLDEWQARLDCSKVNINGSGKALEIKWPILFINKTRHNIRKNVSLYAKDRNNLDSGWRESGEIKIRGLKGRILTFGQTIIDTISKENFTVTYTFSASKDDYIYMAFAKTEGSDFQPYLQLFDPSGSHIAYVYDTTANALGTTLTATGRYVLTVSDHNGENTGSYALTLQRFNNPGQASALTAGQTQSASISAPSEIDAYSFTAASADTLIINLVKTSGEFRPYIGVYDDKGKLLKKVDTSSSVTLSMPLARAGVYYIYVRDSYNYETGSYSIALQGASNPELIQLSFGPTVTGAISAASPTVTYTFSASKDDYIYMAFAKTEGSDFQPYLQLFDPSGSHIAYVYDTTANALGTTLTATGRYVLTVSDHNGENTGSYALTLQRFNNPGQASALTAGQTQSASISAPSEIDAYSFTAASADTLIINLVKTSGQFTPRLTVYDSKGKRLESANIFSDTLSASLPQAGVYHIYVVDSYNYETGSYDISLQSASNPDGAVDIAFGETVTGEISSPMDTDVYGFTVNEGDNLYADIRFPKVSGNSYFSPYVRLYDRSGNMIADSTSGMLLHSLPSAGTYYIFVSDNYMDATGSYQLTLSNETPDIDNLSVTPNPFSPDESGTWVDLDTGEIFNDPGPNRVLDDVANISFTASMQGFFDIKIIDSNSQLVRQLVYDVLTPDHRTNLIRVQWNGRSQNSDLVPNGAYTLIVNSGNVDRCLTATINVNKIVFITIARITPNPFSPDRDGVDETTTLSYSLSENSYVSVEIYNQQNTLLRKLADNQLLSYGSHSHIWDGKDSQGAYLPEGRYTVKISAKAEDGKDAAPVYLNVAILFISDIRISTDEINPYAGEAVTISYRMSHEGVLNIKIYNNKNALVRNLILNQPRQSGTYSEVWDGKDNAGRIVLDGAYYFIIEDSKGGAVYDPRGTGGKDISGSIRLSASDFNLLLNQFCVIDYTLPQAAKINLKVRYDRYSGPAVRVLKYQEPVSSGAHQTLWDGRDETGDFVDRTDFTFAIWGYTLDENSILVVGDRPVISNPAIIPVRFSPYDNPYSTGVSEGTISFNLSRDANVTINIYDSEGNLARNLLNNQPCAQGSNSFIWNGRNNEGNFASEGFYRVAIQAEKDGNYSEGYTLHTEIFY